MGVAIAAAAIGAVGSVIGGLIGGASARRAEAAAAREKARIGREMAAFEANRQAITNPYQRKGHRRQRNRQPGRCKEQDQQCQLGDQSERSDSQYRELWDQ